jgi:hypothetical protein
VQNELNMLSLTKMYNEYSSDNDPVKREMLTVLNWRHAFQTALVWLVDCMDIVPYNKKHEGHFFVTNDIIYKMGREHFDYLNSLEYSRSRTIEGICEYVKRYYPSLSNLCEE